MGVLRVKVPPVMTLRVEMVNGLPYISVADIEAWMEQQANLNSGVVAESIMVIRAELLRMMALAPRA